MANFSKQRPKQPMSSYLLWFQKNKGKILLDNPGANFAQLTKIGPMLWNEVLDKSEWEAKSIEDTRRYETEMEKWRAEGGRLKGKKTKPTKCGPGRLPISKISSAEIKPVKRNDGNLVKRGLGRPPILPKSTGWPRAPTVPAPLPKFKTSSAETKLGRRISGIGDGPKRMSFMYKGKIKNMSYVVKIYFVLIIYLVFIKS